MNELPLLQACAAAHPYPLLFATVSGAHLYGSPSADSDFDLRGVHLLPLDVLLALRVVDETIARTEHRDGKEIDLVTHDARKFFAMLLKRNGYVLEQVVSPWIVQSSPEHEELKAIAAQCVTRHHAHHYLGFASTQWSLWGKTEPRRVKPLLYVYRVLLTGIHLMRTGQVEANLGVLNEVYCLPYVPELIARKIGGAEQAVLTDQEPAFHEREYVRLREQLVAEHEASTLPNEPAGARRLDDLLRRLRLGR